MAFKKRKLSAFSRRRKFSFFKKALFGAGIAAIFGIPQILKMIFQKRAAEKRKFRRIFGIIFLIFAILVGFFWTDFGQRTAKNGFFALGAELPKDKNGFTNILLLGHGGASHADGRGAKLTDSIIVASIDGLGRNAVLLSIPRDFFDEKYGVRINKIVEIESEKEFRRLRKLPKNAEILRNLHGRRKKEFEWKLDAAADEVARQKLKNEIERILKIQIHRVASIDFRGFEKIVDALGGLEINVEKPLDDPQYPTENFGFEHFRLAAGRQKLDGKTALKFARSRHGTSDFDRAARQQKVLSALKTRALSLGILGNPAKLKQIFDIVQSHFKTDISFSEMISLAKIAEKMPRKNIFSFVLHDDPTRTGGFLVTPARELYDGAFVLVPFLNLTDEKYAQIRAFVRVIFDFRDVTLIDPPKIKILNATDQNGLAGRLKTSLSRYGFRIFEIGTADKKAAKTKILFSENPRNARLAKLLTAFFPAALSPISPPKNAENSPEIFQIIIGADFDGVYRTPHFSPKNENSF